MSDDTQYDVIVIGAGPGGLAAGMYAARAKLKSLVMEKGLPGGQINNTGLIEDYPGFTSIDARELAQKMEEHARHFGTEIRTLETTGVKKIGDIFQVETTAGAFTARTVILATGGSPIYLGCPGEAEFQKKGVSYCAICDGPLPLFRNKPMVVVGGGDSAVEEGMFLTKYASKVYLVHRRDELRASRILQDRLRENPKIELHLDSVVEKVGGSDQVEWVQIKNLKTQKVGKFDAGALFIFIGFTPNSHIVKDLVKKDEKGYILTNQNMMTSVPGLFAIGDVRRQLTRQITNAVGDGTTAAVAAEKFIHGRLQAWEQSVVG
ncbi:MAG: thioredoxin-disulfide reductase [Elusimicrobia bacterium RIFCSPLOWO2_01_FULL_59_12]|nr:MAG: thioredoxin-disulfide reductase [Elusimicrobia bacterium RIFCSPLOWO2_01_FULL_59_12]